MAYPNTIASSQEFQSLFPGATQGSGGVYDVGNGLRYQLSNTGTGYNLISGNPSQAPSTPGLTVNSSDYVNRPSVSQPGDINSYMTQANQFFTPLSEERKAQIAASLDAQYAPILQEAQRINALRDTLFRAGAAQRGDVGFGASEGFGRGNISIANRGASDLAEIAREKATRLNDAIYNEAQQLEQSQAQKFNIANTLRQQALQEFNQNREYQQNQAQSTLGLLSNLDATGMAALGLSSDAIKGIESGLGLPSGFVSQLQATKQRLSNAATQKDLSQAFNDSIALSLQLPEGQSVEYKAPDGTTFSVTGRQKDIQIVDSGGGIYSVDKNTNKVTTLKAPTKGGGTGKIPDLTPIFTKDAGFVGYQYQNPKTGQPQYINPAGNQTLDPTLLGQDLKFSSPFSTNSPLSTLLQGLGVQLPDANQ